MRIKRALLFLFCVLSISQLSAQDLVGTGTVTFDNSNPCIISFTLQYTNAGIVGSTNDAGPFTTGIFLTDDLFTADPAWDIPVAEIVNGQGCNVGDIRTITVTNQDVSQLPGFVSGTNYYVYYYLDVYDDVSENDEGNNSASIGNTLCTTTHVNEELASALDFKLFYNETQEYARFSLQVPQPEAVQFSLLNTQGQTLAASTSLQPISGLWNHELDLNGYPAGIYWVRIQVGDEGFTRKMMIF